MYMYTYIYTYIYVHRYLYICIHITTRKGAYAREKESSKARQTMKVRETRTDGVRKSMCGEGACARARVRARVRERDKER